MNVTRPINLASIIDGHPADSAAIISAGETTSYGDLRQQVAGLRGGLVGLGVRPGDRVALLMASNWYFVASYLAVLGAGAVAVPLNPQSPAAEIARELEAAQVTVAFVGPTGQAAFAAVDRSASGITHVLVPEGVALPGAHSIEDLLVSDPVPVVERGADDLAALMFTSGTAGSPKAAMLTHGNLRSNLEQVQEHGYGAVRPEDIALDALPIFHIYGLNACLGLALYAGAAIVLVQRFDPASALQTIRDRKVTLIAGVPPMFASWAAMPAEEAHRDDFATVRLAGSGASRLDPALAEAFAARFGVQIGEGYGLTEASPVVTGATFPEPRVGTIGLPVPRLEVRLVDDEGGESVVGDPGEIWVRGPNVFRGYWNDAEATARALTPDGWLRTGDIAVADDDGYLTIVDRAKDLIIVSGFNVYPAEVEDVLRLHAGVSEVAVVGVAHPHTGESVKAFVVPRPDRMLEEDDLIAFCGIELARYKCPTKVQFVETLPIGVGGKVLRRELR
jgi:long-chain acyl-CoA synthetase